MDNPQERETLVKSFLRDLTWENRLHKRSLFMQIKLYLYREVHKVKRNILT